MTLRSPQNVRGTGPSNREVFSEPNYRAVVSECRPDNRALLAMRCYDPATQESRSKNRSVPCLHLDPYCAARGSVRAWFLRGVECIDAVLASEQPHAIVHTKTVPQVLRREWGLKLRRLKAPC